VVEEAVALRPQEGVEARKLAALVVGEGEALAAPQYLEGVEAQQCLEEGEVVVALVSLLLREEAYMRVGQHHVAQSS
jgi:hypothetical protein